MSFGKKKLMTNLTEVKGIQYCVCDSVKQKKQALGVHCSYHSVISQTSHLTALKVFYLFISKDGGGGGGGGMGGWIEPVLLRGSQFKIVLRDFT